MKQILIYLIGFSFKNKNVLSEITILESLWNGKLKYIYSKGKLSLRSRLEYSRFSGNIIRKYKPLETGNTNISSIFSSNLEAFASELPENIKKNVSLLPAVKCVIYCQNLPSLRIKEPLLRNNLHSDIFGSFKCSTTQKLWNVGLHDLVRQNQWLNAKL